MLLVTHLLKGVETRLLTKVCDILQYHLLNFLATIIVCTHNTEHIEHALKQAHPLKELTLSYTSLLTVSGVTQSVYLCEVYLSQPPYLLGTNLLKVPL